MQNLVPWGPGVFGYLARWLRGDQVTGEVGPQGTMFARNLVTRGPDPASWSPERQEDGFLVTRFRSRLIPQGPPTRKSWSFEDQPPMGICEGGYLGTRWCSNLAPWGPSPRGSWSPGDQVRHSTGRTARRVDLWGPDFARGWSRSDHPRRRSWDPRDHPGSMRGPSRDYPGTTEGLQRNRSRTTQQRPWVGTTRRPPGNRPGTNTAIQW